MQQPWLFEAQSGSWIDKAAHDLAALSWVTPLSVDLSLPGFTLIEPDDWGLPKPLVWVATPYSYGPNLYAAWVAARAVLHNTSEAKRLRATYWSADPQLLDE